MLSACARPGRPPGCQRDMGRGEVQPHPLHADPPLPPRSLQCVGSVYDIGHNAINGPPASAGALGVVQGEDPGEDSWRRRHPARTDLGVGPGRMFPARPRVSQGAEVRERGPWGVALLTGRSWRPGRGCWLSRIGMGQCPMHEALRVLPGMAPPLPGLPEGSRINKSMGGGTRSPNPPAPVSSSEGVMRRRAFLTLLGGEGH